MEYKLSTAFVPEKWYIGVITKSSGKPIGSMVPDGKGVRDTRYKIDSVIGVSNRITKHTNQSRYIISRELPPSSEFKLINIDLRYQYTDDPIILDPRGFYMTISFNNFYFLLANVNIGYNKIVNECAWVRNRGYNVLVPTHTVEYQTALNNKRR